MKKKKLIALFMALCLLVSMAMPAFAADISPRPTLSYGNFSLGSGGTRYLRNNGNNFSIAANKTITISYTVDPAGAAKVYFYDTLSGSTTRVYSSYTPSKDVKGYFYIYNGTGSTIYFSNVTLRA